MTWSRATLLAWLDKTEPHVGSLSMFELLEIPPTASRQHLQRAFHAIAATRHPDVWRHALSPRELDRLVGVYGRIAAAYASLRDDETRARVLRETRERRSSSNPPPLAAGERDVTGEVTRTSSPRLARPTTATDPPPGTSAAAPRTGALGTAPPPGGAAQVTLGARALSFYRRAEAALRVGDVAGALLNLRMALAAEPGSAFLRDQIAAAQARLKR